MYTFISCFSSLFVNCSPQLTFWRIIKARRSVWIQFALNIIHYVCTILFNSSLKTWLHIISRDVVCFDNIAKSWQIWNIKYPFQLKNFVIITQGVSTNKTEHKKSAVANKASGLTHHCNSMSQYLETHCIYVAIDVFYNISITAEIFVAVRSLVNILIMNPET